MSMMPPPWSLRRWPPVLWQAGTRFDVPLIHLGTRVIALAGQERLCMGQTVWAGPCGRDAGAGVAWDWVQLKPEVVAMADPLAVVSNLRFVGEEGDVLDSGESALHLTEIVQALPWQEEVVRALRQPIM